MNEDIKTVKLLTDFDLEIAEPLKFLDDNGQITTVVEEGKEIISKLKIVFEEYKDLLALAAPQVGHNKRIFGIRFADSIKFFINPVITKKGNYIISGETCAYLPGKEIIISRPEELTVVYYNEDFKYEDNKLVGLAARLFDQQNQLLDGVSPAEVGLVSNPEEDGYLADLTEEEFKEVQNMYKEFVDIKIKKIKEEIAKSTEIEKDFRVLKFSEDVVNGRASISETEAEGIKRLENEKRSKHAATMATKTMIDMNKQTNRTQLNKMLKNKRKGGKH